MEVDEFYLHVDLLRMVLWGENSPYGGWCVLFVVAFFTLLFRVLAGLRKWRYRWVILVYMQTYTCKCLNNFFIDLTTVNDNRHICS